jgi:hypothetical protein
LEATPLRKTCFALDTVTSARCCACASPAEQEPLQLADVAVGGPDLVAYRRDAAAAGTEGLLRRYRRDRASDLRIDSGRAGGGRQPDRARRECDLDRVGVRSGDDPCGPGINPSYPAVRVLARRPETPIAESDVRRPQASGPEHRHPRRIQPVKGPPVYHP